MPGASAASGSGAIPDFATILDGADEEITSFSATGIDNALEMLSLVAEKTDKASVGSRAAIKVEAHPERRFKVCPSLLVLLPLLFVAGNSDDYSCVCCKQAAFEAYKDEQLPIIRKERPGMRLQQYHDALVRSPFFLSAVPFVPAACSADLMTDPIISSSLQYKDFQVGLTTILTCRL